MLVGTAAAVVGLAIFLYLIFAYRRRRSLRTTQGATDDSHAKLGTPPSHSRQSTTSDSASLPMAPSPISPTSGTKPAARSDEVRVQVPKLENDVTTPSSAILSRPIPLPITTTPLQRRRSWSYRVTSTQDSSNFVQFAEASNFKPARSSQSTYGDSYLQFSVGECRSPTVFEDLATRPDSPTLPELRLSPGFSVIGQPPSSPRSARSLRSYGSYRTQRPEKREYYVMKDSTIIDAPSVSKGKSTYSPRSPSIRMNRACRNQKMQ